MHKTYLASKILRIFIHFWKLFSHSRNYHSSDLPPILNEDPKHGNDNDEDDDDDDGVVQNSDSETTPASDPMPDAVPLDLVNVLFTIFL